MLSVSLVKYNRFFLDLSYIWMNDAEIKQLIIAPDFTKEDQLRWFKDLKLKTDYLIWGVVTNGIKVGACGLKNITSVDCEYWGYIGNKTYWGKGVGYEIMQIIEQKARSLNLNSIWLQVLRNNERAIKLYKKSEFIIEKTNSNLFTMRKCL